MGAGNRGGGAGRLGLAGQGRWLLCRFVRGAGGRRGPGGRGGRMGLKGGEVGVGGGGRGSILGGGSGSWIRMC